MKITSLFALLTTLSLAAGAGCAAKKSSGMTGPMLNQPSGEGLNTPMAPTTKSEPRGFGKLISGKKSAVRKAEDAKRDPIALSNETKPNTGLFVVMAQMHERSGNFAAAEEQYQRALKQNPASEEALLGYARMVDRQGDFQQANELYSQAISQLPENATVRNDFGLCLARQKRLDQAAGMLQSACKLKPQEVRYRNNLALVLVESGEMEEAYLQLSDVHPPAVAYYNVGFLLAQRGHHDAARHHFEQALKLQPGFQEAAQWLATLPPANDARMVQQPRYGTTPPAN